MRSHTTLYRATAVCRLQTVKCDGTRAETRFRVSAKRTSPFKSAGASVQSTNDSRGVRISGINAGYTMFRGSVKSTGYLLHSPASPSLLLPCVTVCRHISTGLYRKVWHYVQYCVPNPNTRHQHIPPYCSSIRIMKMGPNRNRNNKSNTKTSLTTYFMHEITFNV